MTERKNRCPKYDVLIDSYVVNEFVEVGFLGLIRDSNSSFEKHIAKSCHAPPYKLNALRRIGKHLTSR